MWRKILGADLLPQLRHYVLSPSKGAFGCSYSGYLYSLSHPILEWYSILALELVMGASQLAYQFNHKYNLRSCAIAWRTEMPLKEGIEEIGLQDSAKSDS